jgi:hypothetical protein
MNPMSRTAKANGKRKQDVMEIFSSGCKATGNYIVLEVKSITS